MMHYIVLNTHKESINKAMAKTQCGDPSNSRKFRAGFTPLGLIPVFQKGSAVRKERPPAEITDY